MLHEAIVVGLILLFLFGVQRSVKLGHTRAKLFAFFCHPCGGRSAVGRADVDGGIYENAKTLSEGAVVMGKANGKHLCSCLGGKEQKARHKGRNSVVGRKVTFGEKTDRFSRFKKGNTFAEGFSIYSSASVKAHAVANAKSPCNEGIGFVNFACGQHVQTGAVKNGAENWRIEKMNMVADDDNGAVELALLLLRIGIADLRAVGGEKEK